MAGHTFKMLRIEMSCISYNADIKQSDTAHYGCHYIMVSEWRPRACDRNQDGWFVLGLRYIQVQTSRFLRRGTSTYANAQ